MTSIAPRARALTDAMKSRQPLVMDGAMGTMLLAGGITGCPDECVLSAPGLVSDVHRRYLDAGADIIETCTFSACDFSLASLGVAADAGEINRLAVGLARAAASDYGSARWVAGSIGPSTVPLSQRPETDIASYRDAVIRQAVVLLRAGVDMIAVETVYDAVNGLTAVDAVVAAMTSTGIRVPLLVSATPRADGHLVSGVTLSQFFSRIKVPGGFIAGLNCGFGPQHLVGMFPSIAAISAMTALSPNAGFPAPDGSYQLTPAAFAQTFQPLLSGPASQPRPSIIGGCCGTTPAHIASLRSLLRP